MPLKAPERESRLDQQPRRRPSRSRPCRRRSQAARRPRAGAATTCHVRGRDRRDARHRRPLGLRQVHAAGGDLRASRSRRRHVAVDGGRAERLERCALMPQRDLLLPWRSALDNAALAPQLQGALAGRGAPARRARCSSASASASFARRPARRAVGRHAPARRVRAHAARRTGPCCCSTSRSRRSTRSRARSCRSGCSRALARRAAHDRCSSPTTSRRRCSSATACSCCRGARARSTRS